MKYAILLALLLTVSPLIAQDDPAKTQEEQKPATTEELHKALAVLHGKKGVTFKGRISREAGDQGMGGVIIMGAGMGGGKEFSGNIEVVRNESGVLIASKSKLPGFAIMERDGQEVRRQTTEKKALNLDNLSRDVMSLFDKRHMVRAMKKAQWKAKLDKQSGATEFNSTLKPRAIRRGDSGMVAMLRAKVLKVNVSVTISKSGKLESLTMKVVSSDPNAALRERAMEGMGGQMDMAELEDLADEETEGETVTYAFKVAKAASKRTLKLKTELGKVIDEIL